MLASFEFYSKICLHSLVISRESQSSERGSGWQRAKLFSPGTDASCSAHARGSRACGALGRGHGPGRAAAVRPSRGARLLGRGEPPQPGKWKPVGIHVVMSHIVRTARVLVRGSWLQFTRRVPQSPGVSNALAVIPAPFVSRSATSRLAGRAASAMWLGAARSSSRSAASTLCRGGTRAGRTSQRGCGDASLIISSCSNTRGTLGNSRVTIQYVLANI